MNPTSTVADIVLKPKKAGMFYHRHPWVLDSAIAFAGGSVADGGVVNLLTDRREWIARGIYNSQSRIRVRLYSWDKNEPLDASFWKSRMAQAIQRRRDADLMRPNEACRLIFSEADGLSGLIVDRYGEYLVVQPTALATHARLPMIVDLLAEQLAPAGIIVRPDETSLRREGMMRNEQPTNDQVSRDAPAERETAPPPIAYGAPPQGPIVIEEHGIRYGVAISEGQKTGFYLDQRENRAAAARWMAGRRLLDVCCYSGAFALAAKKLGRAASVHGIDGSARAVTAAEANARLNQIDDCDFSVGDCFQSLDALAAAGETFDAVVLDPPKFASNRRQIDDALRAYHRLNKLALGVLRPGGILVSCSCSGSVSRSDFADMLFTVAVQTGRDIQLLEQRGAAPDHPVSVTCPETDYLKCFICRVE